MFILLVFAALQGYAQMEIHLNLSQNFFNINYGKDNDFFYGGTGNATLSGAVDIQYNFIKHARMKRDSSRSVRRMMFLTFPSLSLSGHYTSHHLIVNGFNADDDPVHSEFEIAYLYLPVIFKYNAQPFVLDEHFVVGIGIGVAPTILLNSRLDESALINTRDANGDIINQQVVSDNKDVTQFGQKVLFNFVFELSWSIGRVYVAQRSWFSLRDQFMSDLAGQWQVPASHSVYLGAHDIWPKVTYGGGAFVIGLRID